jgi:hypothetical protein
MLFRQSSFCHVLHQSGLATLELPTPPPPKKCGSTPTWGPTGRLADLANACLECLLGLITALVRYAIETKEAKGHGDPHAAYRIFADVPADRKSYHLVLPLLHPSFCESEYLHFLGQSLNTTC